jgi:hypothetical protein
MDGKVLILCDEKPGDYGKYRVKDSILFAKNTIDYDDPDRILLCWDSVIPEDRAFIEACKYYAKFTDKPDIDFALSQKGSIDPNTGIIKTSIQEQSYLEMYKRDLQYLSIIGKQGKNIPKEAMKLTTKFHLDANQNFFEEFSRLLEQNQIARILPTYSIQTNSEITKYRMKMLESWENVNETMQIGRASATVAEPIMYATYKDEEYPDFEEVYKRAREQLFEMYSFPTYDESDDAQEL